METTPDSMEKRANLDNHGFSSNGGSPKPWVSIQNKKCVHTKEFLR